MAVVLSLLWGVGCSSDPDSTTGGSTGDAVTAPVAVRVRKSWSSLSSKERKQFIDGVVALKKKTDLRFDYASDCAGKPGEYVKNRYDYYVEMHLKAFQMKAHMHDALNRPHMGPQLLPWHRELLARLEQDLREVLGDPEYTIPYWDWSSPAAAAAFSVEDLGDKGACAASVGQDPGDVKGYIADQGFQSNLYHQLGPNFTEINVVCEMKKIARANGCNPMAPGLPTVAEVAHAMDMPNYDVAPYDSMSTDEHKSFRQYIEGFSKDDVNEPSGLCSLAGCKMHGQVHLWVGGTVGAATGPNDPIFFLLHSNLDRIWAEWQDKYGDKTYPSTAPDDYTGALFGFTDEKGAPVEARTTFDNRAHGYIYDTQK